MAIVTMNPRMMVIRKALRRSLWRSLHPGSHWFIAMRVGYTTAGRVNDRYTVPIAHPVLVMRPVAGTGETQFGDR